MLKTPELRAVFAGVGVLGALVLLSVVRSTLMTVVVIAIVVACLISLAMSVRELRESQHPDR